MATPKHQKSADRAGISQSHITLAGSTDCISTRWGHGKGKGKRGAQVWHAFSRDLTVLPAHPAYIR